MMLHQSTNPPQVVLPRTPKPVQKASTKSALDVISAAAQPLDGEPDLLDVLCYMKDDNDVLGMIGLYDCFADIAETLLNASNKPRATGRSGDYLEDEWSRAWSKAFMVADFLKDVRPDRNRFNDYCRVMFDAAMRLGTGAADAVAVANEMASWPLREPEA